MRAGRLCERCGQVFYARRMRVRYCSRRCHRGRTPEEQAERLIQVHRERSRQLRTVGIPTEPYSLREIAERDNWICGICGEDVNPHEPTDSPFRPTVDHVVPLARDGTDLKMNVQVAHYLCNARKGSRQ